MKILIVEDKAENREAATVAIKEELDFVTTFDEAVSKLEADDYAAVIIDRNFPRKTGQEPEKLGEELEKVVMKYKFPHIFLTEFWHGHDYSQIFLEGKHVGEDDYGPAKSNPKAWTRAWTVLKSITPNMKEIFQARIRHRKYTRKPYIFQQ